MKNMNRRILCSVLALALCLGLAIPAGAISYGRSRYNYSSKNIAADGTFGESFVIYNNFILRKGVHVTFSSYAAVEIYGDLILEEGAVLTAKDGTSFISLGHESSVQGLDLYYRCRFADGSEEIRKLPMPISAIYANSHIWEQMNPEFRYDTALKKWILTGAVHVGDIPEPDKDLFAGHDITLSGTKTFTSGLDNYYRNFTVASGAKITLNIDTRDIRITGKLSVADGAALKGFTTLALNRNAQYAGQLFLRSDGKTEPLTRSIADLCDHGLDNGEGFVAFRYDDKLGGWCTVEEYHTDKPENAEQPGDPNAGASEQPAPPPAETSGPHTERAMAFAAKCAGELNKLGLFRGTGTLSDGSPKYELNRAGTRVEAIVMLIRLLGKESEAQSGNWKHPFTDVPAWADAYVGYAYEAGLTKGISATEFGTGNVTAQQYLTFLLRALGYMGADTYDKAFSLAQGCGIYEDAELLRATPDLCFDPFWRADMALLSRRALNSNGNLGRQLAGLLIEQGVFTSEAWNSVQ